MSIFLALVQRLTVEDWERYRDATIKTKMKLLFCPMFTQDVDDKRFYFKFLDRKKYLIRLGFAV